MTTNNTSTDTKSDNVPISHRVLSVYLAEGINKVIEPNVVTRRIKKASLHEVKHEKVRRAIRYLNDTGLLDKSPYGKGGYYLPDSERAKSYLQKGPKGCHDVRVHGAVTPNGRVKARPLTKNSLPKSWIKGVEFHPPARVHGIRLYGKGRLDPVATECLRQLSNVKLRDDNQWWGLELNSGKVRISKNGGLQAYPKDLESIAFLGEEINKQLSKIDRKVDYVLEGEFGYTVSGARLEEVKKGRVKLELRNFNAEVYFDESLGSIEGETRIYVKKSGDLKAAEELSKSLALPAYLYSEVKEIKDKLDFVYVAEVKRQRQKLDLANFLKGFFPTLCLGFILLWFLNL